MFRPNFKIRRYHEVRLRGLKRLNAWLHRQPTTIKVIDEIELVSISVGRPQPTS